VQHRAGGVRADRADVADESHDEELDIVRVVVLVVGGCGLLDRSYRGAHRIEQPLRDGAFVIEA
jgi:hypothetical protein